MEAALFFFDCLVLLWLLVCAIRADRSGDPDRLGFFRYDDDLAAKRAARQQQKKR